MNKAITTSMLFALLCVTNPASADQEIQGAKGRIAEFFQWRLSYLPRSFQAVDMNDIDGIDSTVTPPVREGAAWLKRSKNAIQGRVMVNVGTAGNLYTIWWVIFNNPNACEGAFLLDADGNELTRCDGSDLGNPAVGGAVYNASGAISSPNGRGSGVINVDVNTVAGNVAEGLCCFGSLRRNNGFSAEVHLVVDKHPQFAGGSYVTDLTTPGGPGNNHRGAIFLPMN